MEEQIYVEQGARLTEEKQESSSNKINEANYDTKFGLLKLEEERINSNAALELENLLIENMSLQNKQPDQSRLDNLRLKEERKALDIETEGKLVQALSDNERVRIQNESEKSKNFGETIENHRFVEADNELRQQLANKIEKEKVLETKSEHQLLAKADEVRLERIRREETEQSQLYERNLENTKLNTDAVQRAEVLVKEEALRLKAELDQKAAIEAEIERLRLIKLKEEENRNAALLVEKLRLEEEAMIKEQLKLENEKREQQRKFAEEAQKAEEVRKDLEEERASAEKEKVLNEARVLAEIAASAENQRLLDELAKQEALLNERRRIEEEEEFERARLGSNIKLASAVDSEGVAAVLIRLQQEEELQILKDQSAEICNASLIPTAAFVLKSYAADNLKIMINVCGHNSVCDKLSLQGIESCPFMILYAVSPDATAAEGKLLIYNVVFNLKYVSATVDDPTGIKMIVSYCEFY